MLHFPRRMVNQPIIHTLASRFSLVFNILRANVTPKEEGLMVLEITGAESAVDDGIKYLAEAGVKVQPLSQDIVRNESRCTHCGACVTICPTAALVLDHRTMKVNFYNDKCIACELCIGACPPRAMEVHF